MDNSGKATTGVSRRFSEKKNGSLPTTLTRKEARAKLRQSLELQTLQSCFGFASTKYHAARSHKQEQSSIGGPRGLITQCGISAANLIQGGLVELRLSAKTFTQASNGKTLAQKYGSVITQPASGATFIKTILQICHSISITSFRLPTRNSGPIQAILFCSAKPAISLSIQGEI